MYVGEPEAAEESEALEASEEFEAEFGKFYVASNSAAAL